MTAGEVITLRGGWLDRKIIMADAFETAFLQGAPVVTAPDGSAVRPLCRIAGAGSFAHFELRPGAVARAVSHATVQEIWYVIAGTGHMWRRRQGHECIVPLHPGVCLTIPLGTAFQFRAAEGGGRLQVVAVTMPAWPTESEDEARYEHGPWNATPSADP